MLQMRFKILDKISENSIATQHPISQCSKIINSVLNLFNLVDIWRKNHGSKKTFHME